MSDAIVVILGWIEAAYNKLIPFIVIDQWELGIRMRFGKKQAELEPGLRWKIPFIDEILSCSVAIETMPTKSQSILTSDKVSISVSGAVKCRINNASKYLLEVKDVENAIGDVAQGIIRQVVGTRTFEECSAMDSKDNFVMDKEITKLVKKRAEDWGIEVESVIITTFDKIRTIRLINNNEV